MSELSATAPSQDAESSTLSRVELYVYDLSGGLARQLSTALLGRQFDGVWHTSIVVHWSTPDQPALEYFFGGSGSGIMITRPGQSHHGQPIERLPLGETEVDWALWQEIMQDLRERYTAREYNLMSYNCNTFSNEVANILVGKDIPAHITSLPSDFQTALGNMRGGGNANQAAW